MVNRSNVISGGASDQHVVEGYRFKVISDLIIIQVKKHTQTPDEENANISLNDEKPVEENQAITPTQAVMETQIQHFNQALLKICLKTDEMSNNIIKLQMQIESQENEFNNRLNSELENAKEKLPKKVMRKQKKNFKRN